VYQAQRDGLFELYVLQNEFDVANAVVGIELRLIGNVKELVVKQLLFQLSEPKTDTSDGGRIVGYRKLEMLTAGANLSWRSRKANAFGRKNRPLIARAERFKHLQLADCFSLESTQGCRSIDV
jgi:hypothetical protein